MASPVGWLAAWIGIALLVRKHEVPYALNLYPLMIPFIAIHLSRPRKNAPTWRILGRRKAGTSATLPGTLEIGTGSYGTFTLYRLS
jgi:hypothetical protein